MNQSPTLMHHKNIIFLSLVQMSNNNIAFMAECTAARHIEPIYNNRDKVGAKIITFKYSIS